jgi:UDP-glucose 4-epimerase
MRVLVTGAAGFVGANLCRGLAAEPDVDVVGIDDLSTGRRRNLDGVDMDLHEASVLDNGALDAAIGGCHAVIHLAAVPSVPRSVADPVGSWRANAEGTLAVLEGARRAAVGHVVAASSSSVYGDNATLPKHEGLPVAPKSPYAASKLAAEQLALAYQASFDVGVLALRFFNVYGPLQPADHAYAAVIPAFTAAALDGRPLTVHGDGEQTRDFTSVASVTAVLVDAVRRGVTADGPVNLAFGSRRSVGDVVAELADVLEAELPVVHTDPRPGDVRDSQADDSRLRALFPDAAPVAFRDGLTATVDWFRTGEVRHPAPA